MNPSGSPYKLVILSGSNCSFYPDPSLGWFQAAIPAIVSGVSSIATTTIQSIAAKKKALRELQALKDEDKRYKENLILQSQLMPQTNQNNVDAYLLAIPVVLVTAYFLTKKTKKTKRK